MLKIIEALRQILEAHQLAVATMKMTDHLIRLFETYSTGNSQCILVVVWIFLRIAVYKLGLHVRLDQMLWIYPKIHL